MDVAKIIENKERLIMKMRLNFINNYAVAKDDKRYNALEYKSLYSTRMI